MDRQVEKRTRRSLQQRLELREIQVVARRHALESVTTDEIIGRPRIRDIEREVATLSIAGKKSKVIVISHQVSVRVGGANLFQDPFFPRFENSRRSNPDRGSLRVRPGQLPKTKHGLA